jgi:hypothetical protein
MASKEDFKAFIEELGDRTYGTGERAEVNVAPLIRPLLDIFESDPNFTKEMGDQIYRIVYPEGD